VIAAVSATLSLPLTRVGVIVPGEGVQCESGGQRGYQHFT
jgi:hypothetical protein